MEFERFKKTQEKVVKLLENSYKKNRLVHTYIFEGAKGTLKLEGAYYLANLLLCEGENSPCGECISCKRIKNNDHPRIFLITPTGDTIKKEQIDELEHEFSRRSLEEGKRVFIILDIDKANLSASNSLLKFLEEMNDDCYGILITENIFNCLPTIKSRSQIVSFNKVNEDTLIKEYLSKGIDEDISKVLAKITNDSQEGEELIKEGKILDIIDLVKKVNQSILFNKTPFLTFYENSKFLFDYNNKKYHEMFLDILVMIISDKIYKTLGMDEKIVFNKEISEIVEKVDIDYQESFKQVEKILEFKMRLKYNINLETMYMQMFIEMMR